jgi:hypothetical protein
MIMLIKKVFFILLLLCGFFVAPSFSMELCKTAFAQMTDSSVAKIFAYTAGSVALYNGIQHAISAGICPELYLSKANCDQLSDKKKIALAAGAGFFQGIKHSLISAFLLGATITAASRLGSRPQMQVTNLVNPVNLTVKILLPISFLCRVIGKDISNTCPHCNPDIYKLVDADSLKTWKQDYGG